MQVRWHYIPGDDVWETYTERHVGLVYLGQGGKWRALTRTRVPVEAPVVGSSHKSARAAKAAAAKRIREMDGQG